MGGALYDHFGFYGPAFISGVLFDLANLAWSASWCCASAIMVVSDGRR